MKKIIETTLPLICLFGNGVSGSEINVLPSGYYKMELSPWCFCDLPVSSHCSTLCWMAAILGQDNLCLTTIPAVLEKECFSESRSEAQESPKKREN